jgi:predicted ABC-type ATPase
MAYNVPFAMETVFSHWRDLGRGKIESKVDLIKEMQAAGYYVILFFVGLSNDQLSIARVSTRVATGGHNVEVKKLIERFPRTQKAISLATTVADAAILIDNSRELSKAFTVCRVQLRDREVYDLRNNRGVKPLVILDWLSIVSPRQ